MIRYRLGLIGWVIVAMSGAAGRCTAAPARVKITSLRDGQVVRGPTVAVRVWFDAHGAVPATGWQLTIDAKHHTSARFPTPLSHGQGSLTWDTRGFKPGVRAVRVKLYRNRTMIGIAGVKVRLDREEIAIPQSLARLTVSDQVTILSPRGGDEVRGQLIVTVRAQAPEGGRLDWVQLYTNDRIAGLVNSPPYEFALNTTRLPDGQHVLIAVTVDDTGRRQRSAPVAIRVANGEAPPNGVGVNGTGPEVRPPSPAGNPLLTGIMPKLVRDAVIGQPDLGEPFPVAAAESVFLPPAPVESELPLPAPVAPASLIKPYLPGRGAAAGDSSTVGAPGLGAVLEENDELSPQ